MLMSNGIMNEKVADWVSLLFNREYIRVSSDFSTVESSFDVWKAFEMACTSKVFVSWRSINILEVELDKQRVIL